MTVRLHFAGLVPGRPLTLLAWAAHAHDPRLADRTAVHFGRELADSFGRHWSVAPTAADCDVVVFAHDYRDGPETRQVADLARAAGKPCLFFGMDESLPPSRLPYGTLYRFSIFERLPHERAMPVFINDVRSEVAAAAVEPLPKPARPRVGFCGYVGTWWSRAALRALGQHQKVDGLAVRAAALRALRADPGVDCDFIARRGYLGSATLAVFRPGHPLAAERGEFLENLCRCPYGLAARGKGNHSVRFSEILAAGRIPLFVNTGCVLPLEAEIPWKEYVVWVEADDIPRLGRRLVEFHRDIDEPGFIDVQTRARRIWEDRLRPEPFFHHVLEVVASGRPAP